MGKSKMRISGNKLRLIAGVAENPLLGNMIKAKMMRQMGLDKLWTARVLEDDPPMLVPAYLIPARTDNEGGE